ncbi:MAG: bifunctional glutamate N-acetyltransferase/amino-acid acetyltransferase ArgJ [Acidimicrobiales bacterium]
MSVTAAEGFHAAGVACGIKPDGIPDLAVVATADRRPASAAAVFTTNQMTAAPVVVSRRHLLTTSGRAAAVVVNSGNANAATGARGLADASSMCELLAAELGCAPTEVLVCSTGLIGIPLPMATIETGIPKVAAELGDGVEAGADAAEAIRTTDTHRKEAAVGGPGFIVGGMAKGAGMLAPNLATMLAVLTTDAAADPATLRRVLAGAAAETFNRFTVDGCTSTNDTVILLASGRAGPASEAELMAAVTGTCADLVARLADDAEGATKVVRLVVTGAASDDEAHRAARAVADSLLVKCSWYGEDPYWGRIASDLGSSGVEFDPDRVSIAYGGVVVAQRGQAHAHDVAAVRVHLAGRHLEITADLGLGRGTAGILTTDLSHAYIDENMGTS